jgi:hypothetical protein
MGLFQMLFRRRETEIQTMNPYVLTLSGDLHWCRWSIVPTLEEIGTLPRRKGLPVVMTKTECEVANGGGPPDYWGEVPYAWRTEEQKQAYYAKYPERFKQPARPYPDQGVALTKKLIDLLNLSDWITGVPDYTELEMRALGRVLQNAASPADQRKSASEALHDLAGKNREDWDTCPDDWRVRVSTYLKAWAMQLDPGVLLDMSRLLAIAGYGDEARDAAAIVATGFPIYAPRFFAGTADLQRVEEIARRARVIQELNGRRAPEPRAAPNLSEYSTEWEGRVAKVVRERPTTHCPDCGNDHVIYYFNFKPSAEERQAIEPYKDFIHFGWNQGCCLPSPGSPRVLEEWTCRACGENWDEVLNHEEEASTHS